MDRGQWIGGSNFLTSTHKTWGFWFDWIAGNGSRIVVKGHWFAGNGHWFAGNGSLKNIQVPSDIGAEFDQKSRKIAILAQLPRVWRRGLEPCFLQTLV
jgi:hypothetical protein